MRKEWMEPVIEVQEFVANEYVAACESGMFINLPVMLLEDGCIIILRVMVQLMETTLALEGQYL